jgi:hypothetical protein
MDRTYETIHLAGLPGVPHMLLQLEFYFEALRGLDMGIKTEEY